MKKKKSESFASSFTELFINFCWGKRKRIFIIKSSKKKMRYCHFFPLHRRRRSLVLCLIFKINFLIFLFSCCWNCVRHFGITNLAYFSSILLKQWLLLVKAVNKQPWQNQDGKQQCPCNFATMGIFFLLLNLVLSLWELQGIEKQRLGKACCFNI